MISSVNYPNNSAVFASAAKKSTAAYQANFADVIGTAAKDSAASTSTATQAGSGVSTFDFTNMTPNQMKGVTQDLLQSGKIGMHESLRLQMMGMPIVRDGYSPEQLAEFANKPVNYTQAIKGELEFLKQGGYASDPKFGYEGFKNLLATLENMQGKTSRVNITA